jgi:amino acid efflux transporter
VPLGADLLSVDALVRACSAAFVAVYVIATAAGVRLLTGAARAAAAVAFAAVAVVLAFSGPYLLVPAAVATIAVTRRPRIVQPMQICTEGSISH